MELTYRAFGLTFGSELAFPGLPVTVAKPIVKIRRAVIPEWQGEPTIQYSDRFKIRGQECAIHFKALPFFGLVRDGNLIQFAADPAQDELSSLHILGSCTGALLFQRGLVPLHANSVVTPAGTLMVAGRIGTGKSTTTMALLRRGHQLLADDISAVSFDTLKPVIVPGFPRLKLWKSTLEQFGLDRGEFRQLRAGLEKFYYPVDDSFCEKPQQPRGIYILQPGDSPAVAIRSISGIEKLEVLRPHLYKVRFRDAIRNWPPLLSKMCRLADSVRVSIVARPREGVTIEAVADAIEEDFAAHHRADSRKAASVA